MKTQNYFQFTLALLVAAFLTACGSKQRAQDLLQQWFQASRS